MSETSITTSFEPGVTIYVDKKGVVNTRQHGRFTKTYPVRFVKFVNTVFQGGRRDCLCTGRRAEILALIGAHGYRPENLPKSDLTWLEGARRR